MRSHTCCRRRYGENVFVQLSDEIAYFLQVGKAERRWVCTCAVIQVTYHLQMGKGRE